MVRESILLAALLVLTGCSGHGLQDWADETFNHKEGAAQQTAQETRDTPDPSTLYPSRNTALESVSPSTTASSKGDGAIQKQLDTWVEKEWTPAVEANESIKEMNTDTKRPFTLQEYADKAEIYLKGRPEKTEPSHMEKLNQLPVIGK